jgi:hypothetical protein
MFLFELAFKHPNVLDNYRQVGVGDYTEGTGFRGGQYYCHDRVLEEAVIQSHGDLWQADVTAFSLDGRHYRTKPANAYVDILKKVTLVPDDVFEHIAEYMDYHSGYMWGEPVFVHNLNAWSWHAQRDEDMADN